MSALAAAHLGPTPYRAGVALQEALVEARAAGRTDDWLLFPDHPPVLTVGRHPSPGSLRADAATLARRGIEVIEVNRGGDITWHGPGQVVGYPICDLTRRGRDLHRFLRDLERGVVATLARFGVAGETAPGRTGVWVDGAKIASIGIAVRRWVSYHGLALNVVPDLGDFDLIHPCGLRGIRMTSLAACCSGAPPPLAEVRATLAGCLARQLGCQGVAWHAAAEVHRAAQPSRPAGIETPRTAVTREA